MPTREQQGGEPELTEEERRKLRTIIRKDDRLAWLSGVIRAWGAWVAGGLLATMALGDSIRDALKGWLK